MIFTRLALKLAPRNLWRDRFGTACAIIGVALGVAIVNTVLVLDVNTRRTEARAWQTNPDLAVDRSRTIEIRAVRDAPVGQIEPAATPSEDAQEETHEDYQVMRSAIRLGSLTAWLVGAFIVFFTFGIVVERRKREVALLRSLGARARDVAGVLALEALIVGTIGAVLGYWLTYPLSILAATAGITTTGRSTIEWLWFPRRTLAAVAAIGGLTALLGVVKPMRDLLRLDVPQTLRPRFLDPAGDVAALRRQRIGLGYVALPFAALLYILIRPFFRETLPSLAFFVFEGAAVCFGFVSMIVWVPALVRRVGSGFARLLPRGPAAERLLTIRRVELAGHEMSWSVSGIMLVFGLLLALHISTHALKEEVRTWADDAIRPYAYVFTDRGRFRIPEAYFDELPKAVVRARFSGRTPWPNPAYAVHGAELAALARAAGREDLAVIAARLGPGRAVVSTMLARRLGVGEGDAIEIVGAERTGRLDVVAVTDDVGYVPMIGPYRQSRTYALLDAADFDLLGSFAAPIGAAHAMVDRGLDEAAWFERLARFRRLRAVRTEVGTRFERLRREETDRDFAIFDVILAFTTALAGIGIANNMMLSAHGRRREIALYRVLGMTGKQVRRLFTMEGAFIGVLGGVLAVGLGVPLGYATIGALGVVSAFDVHFALPASYPLWTIAGSFLVAVCASMYPAFRASNTSSAESVHYE